MRVFPKRPLSLDQQIQRFQDRGLIISDRKSVEQYLTRLWNRKLVIKPLVFKRQKEMGLSNERMAAQFVILYDLLKIVAPRNRWAERLKELLLKHKPDLKAMGFEEMNGENFFTRMERSSK